MTVWKHRHISKQLYIWQSENIDTSQNKCIYGNLKTQTQLWTTVYTTVWKHRHIFKQLYIFILSNLKHKIHGLRQILQWLYTFKRHRNSQLLQVKKWQSENPNHWYSGVRVSTHPNARSNQEHGLLDLLEALAKKNPLSFQGKFF